MDLHSLVALVIYLSEVWLHCLHKTSTHILRKWQESRTIAVGMKNMNYLPGVYATISLSSISCPHKIKAAAQTSFCLCGAAEPAPSHSFALAFVGT